MQTDPTPEQINSEDAFRAAQECFIQGRYDEAEPVFKRTLQEARGDDTVKGACLRGLSKISQDRGEIDDAIRYTLRLLTIMKTTHGEKSEQAVSSMVQLAGLYDTVGRYEESGDLYYRAKALSEQLLWSEGHSDNPQEQSDLPLPDQPHCAGMSQETINAHVNMAQAFAQGREGEASTTDAEEQQVTVRRSQKDDQFRPAVPPETSADNHQSMRSSGGNQRQGQDDEPPAGTAGSARAPVLDADDLSRLRRAELPPTPEEERHTRAAAMLEKITRDALERRTPGSFARFDEGDDGAPPKFRSAVEPRSSGVRMPALSSEQQISFSRVEHVSDSAVRIKKLKKDREAKESSVSFMQELLHLLEIFNIRNTAWRVTNFLRHKENLFATILATIAVVVGVVAYVCTAPRREQPIEAYLSIPHRYRSVDGDKVINLVHIDTCEYTAAEQTRSFPCSMFVGDWRDCLDLAAHSLFQRQYWMYESSGALRDDRGLWFYADNSKMGTLATYIQGLRKAAQKSYAQSRSYPGQSADLSQGAEDTYENPFSGQTERATIERLILPAEPNRESASLKVRQLFDKLAHGGAWPREAQLHPGQINCANIVVPYGEGKIELFLIQVAAADGKPPPGAQPGTTAFAALADGKDADPLAATARVQSFSILPRRFLVIGVPVQAEMLSGLANASVFAFGYLALILAFSFVFRLPRQYNVIRVALLLGALVMTGAYVLLLGLVHL